MRDFFVILQRKRHQVDAKKSCLEVAFASTREFFLEQHILVPMRHEFHRFADVFVGDLENLILRKPEKIFIVEMKLLKCKSLLVSDSVGDWFQFGRVQKYF